jgi:hypothetical protein
MDLLAPQYYGQFDPPLDRVLHERYFLGRRRGVFVECGAFDGHLECSCKFSTLLADVLPEIICAEHGHLGVTTLREALETLG